MIQSNLRTASPASWGVKNAPQATCIGTSFMCIPGELNVLVS